MTREDIEKEAYRHYAPAGMGFDGGREERDAFIEGAEWMQKQIIIELLEYVSEKYSDNEKTYSRCEYSKKNETNQMYVARTKGFLSALLMMKNKLRLMKGE